jgi:predicted DNA-binding transcriptional regulator YafY
MSKREYILRYLTIIKKMRTSKTAIFEDISSFLEHESEMTGYSLVISKRTFQRDLDEIRSLFNIDIQFDFSQKVYFIEMEADQAEAYNRMLESFDLFNALNLASGIQSYVFFDKRKAMGTENFYSLLHAIKNRITISMQYQKFYEDQPDYKKIEPYALKESQNRWYLIAKDHKDSIIKTFGLDRITQVELTGPKFIQPNELNIGSMFKDSFGIIKGDGKPAHVVISCDHKQGRYVKSFPMHETQTIKENKEEFIIELDIHITHDFLMELMKYGNKLKVIKPQSLRKTLTKMFKESLSFYS